jgi:hypothetical protein
VCQPLTLVRSSQPRAGSCGVFATSCRERSPRECNGTARSRGMSREIDGLPPEPTVHSPHSEISDEPGTTGKSSSGMTISVMGEDCNVKTKCRKSSTVSNFATESRSCQKPNPPLDSTPSPKLSHSSQALASGSSSRRTSSGPRPPFFKPERASRISWITSAHLCEGFPVFNTSIDVPQ